MESDSLFPELTEQQLEILKEFGEEISVKKGEIIIKEGDKHYPFYAVIEGCIEIQDPANNYKEIVSHKENHFSGDVDMLSERAAIFQAIAGSDSRYIKLEDIQLRKVIANYSDISDKLLQAFFLRRSSILEKGQGRSVKLIGSKFSKNTYTIRNFLSKNHMRYDWTDVETDPESEMMLRNLNISIDDLPVLISSDGSVYRNPDIETIATCVGLSSGWDKDRYDLLVVGAGPGGLAASVYGASEGLSVITIDEIGPGGQAGKSSKIENYLGFPTGLSGSELAQRAYIQAQKFGCVISVPYKAERLEKHDHYFTLKTSHNKEINASSVIIATGANYKNLPLENNEKFEGNGIYYAATAMQAEVCRGEEIGIVGGGNSAGQAALFLADYTKHVHMVLRSDNLGKSMSDYLVQRIKACDNIEIHYKSEITKLTGKEHLESFDLTNSENSVQTIVSTNLFIFIGAHPCTEWVSHLVETDKKGFVLTGRDHRSKNNYGEVPQRLETKVPGLFAVGDVRSGSTKRVASAVGEGSMAVSMVHQFLSGN